MTDASQYVHTLLDKAHHSKARAAAICLRPPPCSGWISGMAIYSVYYMKSEFFSEGIKGYDWLNEHHSVPNVADLPASHAYLITIESETLEDVYFKMQLVFKRRGARANRVRGTAPYLDGCRRYRDRSQ